MVIVADDSSHWCDLLRSTLGECGLEVLPRRDGEEAVALAAQTSARMVLLDVRMPHMDGLTACARIRALPGYADTPIVMLSGYDNDGLREAARQAGATLFLTKPISSWELQRQLL